MSKDGSGHWGRRIGILILVALVAIQFIPVGKGITNPDITKQVKWDSPRTEELARRACYDCHSNETKWPWYAHIAPVSWLITHDVHEAREHLNFSEWDREQDDADEAAHEVEEGEMPLQIYTLLHPDARLGEAAKAQLIEGLKKTLGD
ncbi:MAG: heme-binding domain-containing protein [Planctomycetota bacterium]